MAPCGCAALALAPRTPSAVSTIATIGWGVAAAPVDGIVGVPLGPRPVDTDETDGLRRARSEHPEHEGAGHGLLRRCHRVLEIRDDRIGARVEGASELALLRARGEEERARGLEVHHRFVRIANV